MLFHWRHAHINCEPYLFARGIFRKNNNIDFENLTIYNMSMHVQCFKHIDSLPNNFARLRNVGPLLA